VAASREGGVELAQAVELAVEDDDVRAEACRDPRRMGAELIGANSGNRLRASSIVSYAMQVAPESISPRVSSAAAARCR
jgi:hypothetical protein